MAHKNRKIRKKRGTRTCGAGHHNKNRGSGNRGGVGMAGGHKGKWTWIIKYAPDYFGRSGFDLPRATKNVYRSINIGDIDESIDHLIKEGVAKKEKGKINVDVTKLKCEKVLGGGKVSNALSVRAHSFTEAAKKKIEASGGEAVTIDAE